jgi:hypothetical protein
LEVHAASIAFLQEALDQLSMFEAASFPEDDAQHCTSNCCDYKIASAELDDPGVGVLAGEMVT